MRYIFTIFILLGGVLTANAQIENMRLPINNDEVPPIKRSKDTGAPGYRGSNCICCPQPGSDTAFNEVNSILDKISSQKKINHRYKSGKSIPQPWVVLKLSERQYQIKPYSGISIIEIVKPKNIEQMELQKNIDAVKNYGESAKGGVLILTLKTESRRDIFRRLKENKVERKRI